MHERADLHELDGGRGVDHSLVEPVAERGGHDREQGPQALAAARRHPHRRIAEQGAVAVEHRGDAVVDRGQPVGEVGDAEQAGQVVEAELGRRGLDGAEVGRGL